MDDGAPQAHGNRESTSSHPRVLRDVLIVGSPLVVLGAAGNMVGLGTLAGAAIINLGYILMIIVGGLVLRRQSSSWREIGLGIPASWLKTALFGVGAAVAAIVIFVAMQAVAIGILIALGLAPSELDQSRFNAIEGNLSVFVLTIVLAWTTIAFGEEMFFRSFLISRMIDFTAIGKWWAIVIAGIVFAAVHFAEGPIGLLSNGAFGVFFGWIYVRSGRNLWITIVGHGLINTLRFTLLYVGAA